MRITLSGNIGSGKGTIGKTLKEVLNYEEFYSMGDIRRKVAKEHGMTIDEFNKLGETESWTDTEVDNYQKNILSKKENVIVDGRLSWYFIPDSLKLFLDIDDYLAAERIFQNQRDSEKNFNTVRDVLIYNQERKKSDIIRYQKYYGINPYATYQYDKVIDRTNQDINQTIEEILKLVK